MQTSIGHSPAPRYALYFRPDEQDPLVELADRWLGRNPMSGLEQNPPSSLEIAEEDWRLWTEAPRRYGFHATLKPPFRLSERYRLGDLERALDDFVSTRPDFETKPLELKRIGGFLALGFGSADLQMVTLASDCVRHFDRFRASLSEAEIAKRRSAGLSERQDSLLVQWGYPYVMDEFRFHMTLTGSLATADQARAEELLHTYFKGYLGRPLDVNAICLFEQPHPEADFRLRKRWRFIGQT